MRKTKLMGLALLSLSLLTAEAMAQNCRPVSTRSCHEGRRSRDWNRGCTNRVGIGLSFGIPANGPAPYIPAPTQPSTLTVGNTVYKIDGGNGLRVPTAPKKKDDTKQSNTKSPVENVRFRPESTAGTAAERNQERRELAAALAEVLELDEFNRICERIARLSPGASVRVVYGDTSEHTESETAGGTFVPDWEDPENEEGFQGGTLIIDKARLLRLRANHDHREFLVEILAHEMVHALQYAQGHARTESPARAAGERAAERTGHRTLAGTNPVLEGGR